MNNEFQAILARDMIDMVRKYSDDPIILERLASFAFSIARMLENNNIVNWFDIHGVCDQRYYSLQQGNPIPLNTELLDSCERAIKPYLPPETT